MNEKRVAHWIRSAERILQGYQYDEPFARFLTRFYKQNKQMGSSDRRMASRFCYNTFRLGHSFTTLSFQERLVFAEFLCESDSPVVSIHSPQLLKDITLPVEEKIQVIERQYGPIWEHIFPFASYLSPEVSHEHFSKNFFVQPDLFIRAKRSSHHKVAAYLEKQGISFKQISDRCFGLANGTNLQTMAGLHSDFEVQDLSSQRTEGFVSLTNGDKWWDCCAASGGKSLMLLDQCPGINLLVSDIRLSILRNLEERFDKSGIDTPYRRKILDLSDSVKEILGNEQFDGILLDAPCSGSGTWGRTPEMLHQFEARRIKDFAELQRRISRNIIPYLRKGGQLVYITCSVFRQENEDIAIYIEKELGLTKTDQKSLLGYTQKADSMFVATFVKS